MLNCTSFHNPHKPTTHLLLRKRYKLDLEIDGKLTEIRELTLGAVAPWLPEFLEALAAIPLPALLLGLLDDTRKVGKACSITTRALSPKWTVPIVGSFCGADPA